MGELVQQEKLWRVAVDGRWVILATDNNGHLIEIDDGPVGTKQYGLEPGSAQIARSQCRIRKRFKRGGPEQTAAENKMVEAEIVGILASGEWMSITEIADGAAVSRARIFHQLSRMDGLVEMKWEKLPGIRKMKMYRAA